MVQPPTAVSPMVTLPVMPLRSSSIPCEKLIRPMFSTSSWRTEPLFIPGSAIVSGSFVTRYSTPTYCPSMKTSARSRSPLAEIESEATAPGSAGTCSSTRVVWYIIMP